MCIRDRTAVNRFYQEIHVPDLVAAEDIPPPAASADVTRAF